MKKTVFLVLLSLSLCLCKPAEAPAEPAQAATLNALNQDPAKQKDEPTTTLTKVDQTTQNTTHENQEHTPPQSKPGPETASKQPNATKASITADDSNKTSDKKEDKTEKTPASPVTENPNQQKNTSEAKPSTEKSGTNKPTPDIKPKNETTTPKVDVTTKIPEAKTTEAPKADADKHTLQARGFDGPSFIGGMVLTLALLAFGFMGFKYYKNQTERNYHTL